MDIQRNKCVKKSIHHPVHAVTNFLTLNRASFTDYSKATRVRKEDTKISIA